MASREARSRALSLIDYLAAFDARNNPPVRDIAAYHSYLLRDTDLPETPGVRFQPGMDAWLTVDFMNRPPKPAVPAGLEGVMDVASIGPTVRPVVTLPEEPTDAIFALAEQAERWVVSVWEPWSLRYRQIQRTKRLYQDLFEQAERVNADRESVELVWGFGRLRWLPESGQIIDHPLLTIPVEIDRDAESNKLQVRPAGATEVESLFLAGISLHDQAAFNAIRQSVADLNDALDPWDRSWMEQFLRRLVRAVDHNGVLVGEGDATADAARVEHGWVLYLRRRRPDYQGFLDSMRELYRAGAELPESLQAVVVDESITAAGHSAAPEDQGQIHEPLLLPLATNEEQQRILTLAQSRAGVTVQGPPGTGKSHTIANLISHFVAYGRRVLVVAEKEQALRVLAEKIPDGIRDLTVSVLGADVEGRRRLESSIAAIQSQVTSIDRTATDQAINRLERELDEISRKISETTDRLLATRAAEVTTLRSEDPDQPDLTPAAAARWVADHEPALGYVDDHLAPDAPLPLTIAEFAELAQLLRTIGASKAAASELILPNVRALPTGITLEQHFASLDAIREELAVVGTDIRSWALVDRSTPESIGILAERLTAEHSWSVKIAGSWMARVRDQLSDPLLAHTWREAAAALSEDRRQLIVLGDELAAHDVTIPSDPEPAFVAHLHDAAAHLRGRNKIGLFAAGARRALQQCAIDGHQPATFPEVQLCLAALQRMALRRRLVTRWANASSRIGGPPLDTEVPEDGAGRLIADLEQVLGWPVRWNWLADGLRSLGISVRPDPSTEDLERLARTTHLAARRLKERAMTAKVDQLAAYLTDGASRHGTSPLWGRLADALNKRHVEDWERHRAEVADLLAIMPQVKQLRDIHRRLAAATPVWANRMFDDPSAAGDPTRFPDAWRWRRLETWLDTIQRANDPSTLQRQLEQLAARRRRVTAELVSERAWRRLADCLGPVQRQALNSYMQAVKRFGKTGGKYAARWLREIREALNESKQSVPVWIMTTNRALSSFRPDATPAFDVLIIDEASQISLQALPLLSLARRAIIVGDDKQTSPDHVGLDRQAVFGLLDDHLSTISKYKTLFDPDNSLYDLAVQKFPEIITLTEHFRCLPPIIQFSNIHAYDGRIIPLRDQAPSVDWKPLSSIFVRDGYRVGDINEPEADAVVELLEMLHTNPRYEGMDFGVISLLGSSQSKRIWDKVLDRLGPDVLTDRRLRCGEPANFQGDERDVMILSTVVATDPNVPTARIGAMTGRAAERRINVAASRARNQMWVVHSVDPDRFPPGDLRGELIRHCQNPTQLSAAVGDLEAACDSDFERHVLRKIVARGYRRLTTQHRVGRFRIDIVVHGPNARLAVECDGDRWHGEEEWHRDRARQQVLERAGWTFERIRGSSFYRDPDRALEPLWRRLDELGIPLGEWVDEVPSATTSIPMAQPVRRRDGLGDNTSAATAPTPEVDGRQGLPLSSSQTRRSEVAEPPAAELPSIRALPVRATSDSTGERLPQHLSDGAPAHRPFLAPRSTPPPAPQRATTAQPGNGGAFGHARRASPAQPARRTGIAPYSSWQMRPLPSVYDYPRQRTISGLVEIVAAEGPILVWRAFQLYVKASGGERVGSAVREQLLRLVASAARSGRLAQIKDGVPRIEKTLYMPGTPPVILRQRGPRQLIEIPRSEIKALVEHLGLSGAPPATVKRAVLDVLELTRLTSRVDEYLDDCFSYQWYP